uniref:DUF3456 domain-containing protein n=1 Tax=Alexandrium monilatum TaxID=311494 RepID=A0A7S4VIK3_9DINO
MSGRCGQRRAGRPPPLLTVLAVAVALALVPRAEGKGKPAKRMKKSAEDAVQGPVDLEREVASLGDDLACSACALSTKSLRLLMGSKVKKSMKGKAKRKAAADVLGEVCKASNFPEQLASTGKPGKREYKDWQEVIGRGGSVHSLSMTADNNRNVMTICHGVIQKRGDAIVDKAAAHKERLGAFNWERWLCVQSLGICPRPLLDKSGEEDEAEDEDGERGDGDL